MQPIKGDELRQLRETRKIGWSEREDEVERAVALGVDEEGSPRVVAMGSGAIAEEIRRRAEVEGVPVERAPEIVEELSRIKVGGEVPESLYELVMALINFTWKLDESLRGKVKRVLKGRGKLG